MPGTNQVNRVRQNFQKQRRTRTSSRRQQINKKRYDERAPLILNSHQKRMLKSNPQANIALSKKKIRQMTKAINHERLRLEEKGLAVGDVEMMEGLVNPVKVPQPSKDDGMEITGSGAGTTLGAPF